MLFEDFNLVEAFDTLSLCEDPEQTWSCALEIANALGVSAINIGKADIPSEKIIWARSSMPQSWLDTYMACKYFEVDPLLKIFKSKNNRLTIYCDPHSISSGDDGGDPNLSQALNDAGYSLLHGTKFASPDADVGTMVTLCFEKMNKATFNENISNWTMLSALFAGVSMTPNGISDQNVFAFDIPVLTAREIEVLSLLAEGHKTARIAGMLKLAEITVAKHFSSGRKKLNAATREQAVITAMKRKIISV